MLVRRRIVRMRHVRHLTRLTYQREAWGKSPYISRLHIFRHTGQAK